MPEAMQRYHGLDGYPRDVRAAITVGTFDGVHAGHEAIIRDVVRRAGARGGPGVVVTFDPHPREVVTGEPVALLSTLDERAACCEALGVERFVVVPFTADLASWSAERFAREVLFEQVGFGEIVVGHDHGFGRGREGGVDLLRALGDELGFAVDETPPLAVGGVVVSSSEVRRQLAAGDVAGAAALLGRPYAVEGKVVRGDQRGRLLGYPTANVAAPARKIVPANGVYAVRAEVGGERFGGVMNVGTRPTFDGEGVRLEAHLFGFEGDLYGQVLRVEFVERIRDEQRFSGVDALRVQLAEDAAVGRALLARVS